MAYFAFLTFVFFIIPRSTFQFPEEGKRIQRPRSGDDRPLGKQGSEI